MGGLFEKRIEDIESPAVSMIEDGFEVAAEIKDAMLKVVEEAKKDFRKTIIYLPMNTETEKIENLLNERVLVKTWFVRWFGGG